MADAYAAGPTVIFRMTATETSGVRVHAVALRSQVRVEPIQRHYSDREADQVVDLFGDRSRWGQTLQPMQLAFLTQVLPSFTGSCDFDLTMPCSYDVDVAAHKYLTALEAGDVPLILLFSGTVFSGTVGLHPGDARAVAQGGPRPDARGRVARRHGRPLPRSALDPRARRHLRPARRLPRPARPDQLGEPPSTGSSGTSR